MFHVSKMLPRHPNSSERVVQTTMSGIKKRSVHTENSKPELTVPLEYRQLNMHGK